MWITHDNGFSSIQEVFSGYDRSNNVIWTVQLENAARNFNAFAFDDLGWSDNSRHSRLIKVQMSRRSLVWNGKRRHLQSLFGMLTQSFDNLMCDVGCDLPEFNVYMRYFLILEHIIDLVLSLLYKEHHYSSVSTGWDSLPVLDGYTESWSCVDYCNLLFHMVVEEGINPLCDGYIDFFNEEVVDNEWMDEGEIYKLLFMKYVIFNLRLLSPIESCPDVRQRLAHVVDLNISNTEQISRLVEYLLHVERLLIPSHNLRGRFICIR